MRQLGTEEKAALLLTPIDDDDEDQLDQSFKTHHDQFSTVSKRPKTFSRTRSNSSHPVLLFILILSAFIFGCLSGVVIMIYRISQDTERSSSSSIITNQFDHSIQMKFSQTISKTNFVQLNSSNESLNESAKKLEQIWLNYPKVFNQVKQISYDLTLTKFLSSNQWNGIELIDENKNQELTKFNLQLTDEYLTYSSLIKSGQFDGKFVCYVNYGREEDFAYLFQQNVIQYENHRQTIVFMRRKSTIISQTEQIRQAIRYEFGGLVLFDDNDNRINEKFNSRQTIHDQWKRISKNRNQQNKFLEDFSIDNDQQIILLILSNSDVENLFSSIPSESNQWSNIPDQWYSKSSTLKLAGEMKQYKLRMNSFIQEIPVQLPIVIGQIQGQIEQDQFIIVGYQLGQKQQEIIINEIIRVFNSQGWKPRRSMLFCAWSDLTSDHFTVERWINENKQFVRNHLIGYLDLADGIQSNTTLNLHGSPLFEQIASRTADFVVSPLIHDHTCHHRQTHIHRKRRHDEHSQMISNEDQEKENCQPHKLLDEWIKTTKSRFQSNETIPIVQLIDSHSSASIFQLKYGIPSLTIEMTDQQSVDNQTFYSKKLRSTYSNDIQPEIFVSYTQFLIELIRQLIDQPIIPFNLTNYADLIDTQTSEYFAHFDRSYRWLNSALGDSNEMSKLITDLTKSIRQNQHHIDKSSKDFIQIQQLNQKLIHFERLFLSENSKHLFIGPAFGLTNTVVSYPILSNLLYNITSNPPTEITDAIKYHWINLQKQIRLINKTLNGLDSLLIK